MIEFFSNDSDINSSINIIFEELKLYMKYVLGTASQ